MKLIRKTPEAAMVVAFLRAELDSERFREELSAALHTHGVVKSLILNPDITNSHDNRLRAKVLGEYRGYRQNREMFIDVPDYINLVRG
jgi:hypothetical protein